MDEGHHLWSSIDLSSGNSHPALQVPPADEATEEQGPGFQSTVPADRVGIVSPWEFSPQARPQSA